MKCISKWKFSNEILKATDYHMDMLYSICAIVNTKLANLPIYILEVSQNSKLIKNSINSLIAVSLDELLH